MLPAPKFIRNHPAKQRGDNLESQPNTDDQPNLSIVQPKRYHINGYIGGIQIEWNTPQRFGVYAPTRITLELFQSYKQWMGCQNTTPENKMSIEYKSTVPQPFGAVKDTWRQRHLEPCQAHFTPNRFSTPD